MIKHYSLEQLGKADHGWLKARHHFSFAHYYNPSRMGFGTLRVINDDWVEPGQGFAPHPHSNMEIISFIRSGEISHQDSMGNKGKTNRGEVQVMSAGSGIIHSEYNLSAEPLTLYQIWIETNKQNVEPRWESRQFPTDYAELSLPLLVSGYAQDADALYINQQARIFGGKLKQGTTIDHPITHQAYILASEGSFEIHGKSEHSKMNKGDGAEVTGEADISIKALTDCELVVIDAP